MFQRTEGEKILNLIVMSSKQQHLNNSEFAALFFDLFQSEIMIELPENFKEGFSIFLMDKKELLIHLNYEVPIVFKGFGQKVTLLQAIDETEFHLAILSFFKRYGNIYRKTEYLDDSFEEIISVAFYNPFKEEIEVLTRTVKEKIQVSGTNNIEFVHLHWLKILKDVTFGILKSLESKKIDAFLIKKYHSQYIEIQKQEQNKTEDKHGED